MDLQTAEQRAKQGAYAALVLAGLIAVFPGMDLVTRAASNSLNFILAIFVAILGFFVLRFSRSAAITLIVVFLLNYVIAVENRENLGSTIVYVVLCITFLYFFGQAVYGTISYHRSRGAQDPNYRAAATWKYVVGIPIAAYLAMGWGVATLEVLNVIQTYQVLHGDELKKATLEKLVDDDIIDPSEGVELFYSDAMFSVLGDGQLITGHRVVQYKRGFDGVLTINSAEFAEISNAKIIKPGNLIFATVIEIQMNDGESFEILASPDENGDKKFLWTIRNKMTAAR